MWDDFDFERRLRSPVDAEERFAAFFTVALLATFFVDFFGGIVGVEVRGARTKKCERRAPAKISTSRLTVPHPIYPRARASGAS